MRISKVIISGTAAVAAWKIDIPTGIIGAQVQLVFADPVWEGMHKTISFEGAAEVEPIVDPGEMVKIPAAVVSESNTSVKIGITGIPADGSEMIPTLWAELGTTKPAPVINCEDESIPPLWAQLLTKLGDLEDLNTENKSNLVAAVNEVLATGGNGSNVDLSGYVKSVNGVAPDENGNVEIKVGSDSGQNADQTATVWSGKTASFYGDSLTEVNYHYSKGYHKWVSEILGLASYNNYGKSGYKVSDVYSKVNSVNDTADIIFVMCGVNDENFSVPLGAVGDTTSGTTYGALNLLCALLKQKYPTKLVVFITPHYQTKYPHSAGITSYEVSKAVREVCEKYAIPVYDNFVLSGIYSTNLSTFTTDNCHWNDVGHEMVGKNLARFMLNNFSYLYGAVHTHSYVETVTTPATCTTAGVKTFTCACGDKYTQSIPATGHKWDSGVVTTDPTETTQGVKTYTCTVCGETRTETIPALDHEHSYTSTVVPPTCTDQGYTEHVCACGDSYKDAYVAATGHSYTSEVTTEATCTTSGVRKYTCSVCGDTYTESIPATGHNCVDGVCSVCGAKEITLEIINGDSVSNPSYDNQTLNLNTPNDTFGGVTFTNATEMRVDLSVNKGLITSAYLGIGWLCGYDSGVYHAMGVHGSYNLETYDFSGDPLNAHNNARAEIKWDVAKSNITLRVENGNVNMYFDDSAEPAFSVVGSAIAYITSSAKAKTIYGVTFA